MTESRRILILLLLFIISTSQFVLLISGLSTAPFWSQDIHSKLPFGAYNFPHTSGHYFYHPPGHSHYTAESAFKAGYSVEEKVSPELVKYVVFHLIAASIIWSLD